MQLVHLQMAPSAHFHQAAGSRTSEEQLNRALQGILKGIPTLTAAKEDLVAR